MDTSKIEKSLNSIYTALIKKNPKKIEREIKLKNDIKESPERKNELLIEWDNEVRKKYSYLYAN